jgi:Fic family protein
MAILAYNLSSKLEQYLTKIETLRRQILLKPLPPRNEVRLRWEANLQRVFWSLSLTDNSLSKEEVIRLLRQLGIKKLGSEQKQVLNYKKAFDYISENWLVSSSTVSFSTVKKLFEICFRGIPSQNLSSINSVKKEVELVLEYLQTGNENPVIQAGIAQITMIELSPRTDGNGSLARLIPYLFLYKYGYDFRGLLVFDEYLRRDVVALKAAIQSVKHNQNLTLWLEYFAYGIITQLEKALEDINKARFQVDLPASFWKLNDRQREILLVMEQPGVSTTNKNVQKMFGVSQITASRDLAKLASLGLVFAHGKGRSVYYTKA